MKSREVGDYIEIIHKAMENSQDFVADYTYNDFKEDEKTQYAVIWALKIISEMSRNIPEETKDEHSDIPWNKLENLEKILTPYNEIDLQVVWDTVRKDIKPLIPEFRNNHNHEPQPQKQKTDSKKQGQVS